MPTAASTARWVVPVAGAALVWGSLGFVGYAAGWTFHAHRAQGVLVDQAQNGPVHRAVPTSSPAPCVQSPPQVGQLAGTLQIPTLGLQAPVEEGTDDAELDVAAGHAPASVWPGQPGTAVLLAHDVSYFLHIGSLQPGDVVRYRDQCAVVSFRVTGQQVVQAGDPVYNSPTPTLVLDTCWPTNALFYTSQRLLVTAVEDPDASGTPATTGGGASGTASGGASGQASVTPQLPAEDVFSYTVPAPADLVAQGLTLAQNEAPMGTMTLTGQPSQQWEESPGPLALEAAGLQAYFGGIHAAEQGRGDWWSAIAPGVPMPTALGAAQVSGHNAPLDVSIDAAAGQVRSVTLTTELTISGGPAPGRYHVVVAEVVAGAVVTIASWEMQGG